MKSNRILQVALLTIIYLFTVTAFAAALSPVGKWKTIDDVTNKPRSIVQIWQNKGIYYAKILRVFPQPGDTGYCRKCPGNFKDKPVKGLTFMWDVKQTGANDWSGGRILDPKSGNIYRVKLSLSKDNKILYVRGYIGISLLGRTQNWLRQ